MKTSRIVIAMFGIMAVGAATMPQYASAAPVVIDTATTGVQGNADTGTASNNNLIVTTGGVVTGNAVGGYAAGAGEDATNNHLAVNGTGQIDGYTIGGNSSLGNATGNTVNISGGTVQTIFGGYVNDATGNATGNTVTISGGTINGSVFGGWTFSSTTGDLFTGNELYLNSNTNLSDVTNFEYINFGNIGTANIFHLDTTVNGGTAGSLVKIDMQGGSITFNGTIIGTGGIEIGAGVLALTTNNTYTGDTVISQNGTLQIGINDNTGSVSGNIINYGNLIFSRGDNYTYDGIISGTGELSKVTTGTLTLTGNNTYTGLTVVSQGTIVGNIGVGNLHVDAGATYDGLDVARSIGTLAGAGNIINGGGLTTSSASDSTFSGVISGAGGLIKDGTGTLTLSGNNTYTGVTEVKDGILIVTGNLVSSHLILHNGVSFNRFGGTLSGLNQLDVKGSAGWTGNLSMNTADNILNFYIVDTMTYGEEMLRVSGTTNITGATVKVGIDGGTSALAVGDTIVLINSLGGLTADQDGTQAQGIAGIANLYKFDLTVAGDELLATAAEVSSNEQTKALPEGQLGGIAFVNQGADLVAGTGMSSALKASTGTSGIAGFMAFGGGQSKYKTGSHVDVTGFSLMAGAAKKFNQLTAGAFVEAGFGSYDSFNSFNGAQSVKGNGDTSYYGIGLLTRYDITKAMYTEASLRAGQVKSDFNTDDWLIIGNVKYDTSAIYYGAHVGGGYILDVADKVDLDMSAKLFWTTQGASDVTIAGDKVEFDAVNSMRVRVGGRALYALTNYAKPFAGLYADYELGGKQEATINGEAIDTPELSGITGIGELGLSVTPSAELPLTLDAGVQGYGGVRTGFGGTLAVKYIF